MTKKDYELIAEVLAQVASQQDMDKQYIVDEVAYYMATKLQEQNPRFDRNKFLTACGIGHQHEWFPKADDIVRCGCGEETTADLV